MSLYDVTVHLDPPEAYDLDAPDDAMAVALVADLLLRPYADADPATLVTIVPAGGGAPVTAARLDDAMAGRPGVTWRVVLSVEDLTDEEAALIMAAEVAPEHAWDVEDPEG